MNLFENQEATATVRRPTVSVLIAAWNEGHILERCLESLINSDRYQLEIIVCAGGEDRTYETARTFEDRGVRVLKQEAGVGKQRALRRCYAQSRGDVIYLTDADCIVTESTLHDLLEPILSGRFEAATGAAVPLPEQSMNPLVRFQWTKDLYWRQQQSCIAGGILGRNAAITRSALELVGAFSSDVDSGTDYHLSQNLRLAGIPICQTSSVVRTEYAADVKSYLRMWRRWNKNILVQGAQTRAYRELAGTSTGIVASGIILSSPFAALIFGFRAALPGIALLAWSVSKRLRAERHVWSQRESKNNPTHLFRTASFVVLDAVAAVAGLVAALVPSMRKAW